MRSIALLMRPDSGYYRGVLRGIKRYAEQAGGWVFGMAARTDDLPRMIRTFRPAGVLAFSYSTEGPHRLRKLGVPVVLFSNNDTSLDLPMAGIDDLAVGRMGAEYFLERGYRNLAFVGCPSFAYSNQREQGFEQTLKDVPGVTYRCFHDPQAPDAASIWAWTSEPRVQRWLTSLPLPAAILAANDAIALRLAELCRQLDLRVPEEIAILGVDDDDLFCTLAQPPLSSIRTPLERVGYESARLLDRLMHGGEPPKKPILLPPVGVVTRRSSDLLAINDPDLAMAIRYIHDNAHRPFNIKQALDQLPMSRRLLERKCKAVLGRTPLEELMRVRLQRVRNLLISTDLPMPAIAQRCGFSSAKQLSMTFRQQLKTTPTAYRQQHRIAD